MSDEVTGALGAEDSEPPSPVDLAPVEPAPVNGGAPESQPEPPHDTNAPESQPRDPRRPGLSRSPRQPEEQLRPRAMSTRTHASSSCRRPARPGHPLQPACVDSAVNDAISVAGSVTPDLNVLTILVGVPAKAATDGRRGEA